MLFHPFSSSSSLSSKMAVEFVINRLVVEKLQRWVYNCWSMFSVSLFTQMNIPCCFLSALHDPAYRDAVENSASFNTRMSLEKKMRLPFLDAQTGKYVNNNCQTYLLKELPSLDLSLLLILITLHQRKSDRCRWDHLLIVSWEGVIAWNDSVIALNRLVND